MDKDFFEELNKNPDLVAQLKRASDLSDFKERYNVSRSSSLRCPACNQWGQSGGSLWVNKDYPEKMVCRKCYLEWEIKCLSKPIEEVIKTIKNAGK